MSSFIQHKGAITAAVILPLSTVRLPGSGSWHAVPPAVLQRHPHQPEPGEAWCLESVPVASVQEEDQGDMEVEEGDPLSSELQRLQGTAAALQEENRQWKTLCNELHQSATEACVVSLSR